MQKVYDAMERHLKSWSQRSLTLLGRILIIKTFAMSQSIFLLQSMSISDVSIKKLMSLIFKYLWNKNLNAERAPDRIKRSTMLTQVKDGGFGMIDLKDVADSLDLRAYGRLSMSEHPFLKQLMPLVNASNFFDVKVSGNVDGKLVKALKLVNIERRKILDWPIESALSSSYLTSIMLESKLSGLMTEAGRRSLLFFAINRRHRHPKVSNLTVAEYRSIERFISLPGLRVILKELVANRNLAGANGNISAATAYPTSAGTLMNIGSISSKTFREIRSVKEPICIYKLGPILTPGELLSWTRKLKS